jgi:hypothetical protein
MATTYISWANAADPAAYRIARDLAASAGNELLLGAEGDPGPVPAIPTGHPSSSYRVEIPDQDAANPRRWGEALALAQRLGQQVVIVGPFQRWG